MNFKRLSQLGVSIVLAAIATSELAGCASGPVVVTDSRTVAAGSYRAEQSTADEYRKHGEFTLGAQAQQRADEQYERSQKKYPGFFAWLLDAAFTSWLYSTKP